MNNHRIDKNALFTELSAWSAFLKRRVRLIACGGTAMTLLDIKGSTKDIDFIVPDLGEFKYLTDRLAELGYSNTTLHGWKKGGGFIYDLFPGDRVYSTELLTSPLLPGGNIKYKEFDRIYVGILNYQDILITKLFRASAVDIEDCLGLFKSRKSEIDLEAFAERFRRTASHDVAEDKVLKHLESFIRALKREKPV